MIKKQQILIIDDKAEVRLSARFLLSNYGFDILEADSPVTGLQVLKQENISLVLLDMNFSLDTTSGEEGLYCLKKIRALADFIPVIVITAWSNTPLVVNALQQGAQDFIEKPWDNQRLVQVIKQNLKLGALQQQNAQLQQQTSDFNKKVKIVALSPAMKALKHKLDDVAKTSANVLLTGDNGTGKSTLAHYIHQQSLQNKNTLVSVNMGAIVENLFESEMFGHIKGAFTGADKNRIGRFELANNGSLFLDEVANIPLSQQAKLLRVLENGEYEQVGSSKTKMTNVRLISATNGDFDKLIYQGLFRQDLYFRLNTIKLEVPSLNERIQDIPTLALIFLNQHIKRYQKPDMHLTEQAIQALVDYQYEGNLRELSHIIERIVIMHDPDVKGFDIKAEHLELDRQFNQTSVNNFINNSNKEMPFMTFEAAERQLLRSALTQTFGQTIEAAKLLGISKSAIYRRLEKYQIIAKDYIVRDRESE
ncbi:sigma-54-dependent Fis family transcriptional regulator [Pseudoalteromonas sp. NBT06-2]|uniref:sigma-54-dependent transcriptional regulator n=1 Tax=Pseudoalteromonas sp. NBT06-2 TaxID=2025950 RepID=UPI000BA79CF0|nr:sigma-54 dependent transcriptional regulator [Pseudoalteromonas sp. NBT06-2]PAJ73737.1 sigma-54-dependent Fis family transcriptional regulator [Pseudoalteromonas sp. NBT06-2]